MRVAPGASTDEIKKSYRKLAHAYHPDKNAGNEIVSAYFMEIQEAYAVLLNPIARRVYDRERSLRGEVNKKTRQLSTETIIQDLVKIEDSLSSAIGFSANKELLADYCSFLFSENRLSVLIKESDESSLRFITDKLFEITSKMPLWFFQEIKPSLEILVGVIDDRPRLLRFEREQRRAHRFQKALPYIVVLLVLGLCVAMYFFAR